MPSGLIFITTEVLYGRDLVLNTLKHEKTTVFPGFHLPVHAEKLKDIQVKKY